MGLGVLVEERCLPDGSQGWRELCAKMQQEKDPQQLAVLVGEINSLLAEKRNIRYALASVAQNGASRGAITPNATLQPELYPSNVVKLTQ